MEDLKILQATLLGHIESQFQNGTFDLLKKMFFIQKVNKCFEEMDEEFTYYDLYDLLSEEEELNNLLTPYLPVWFKNKITNI